MADVKGMMHGRRGLVMGVANDHSIAWGIARTLAAHGAEIAFTYQGDAQAKRLKPLAASIDSSKSCCPAMSKTTRSSTRRSRAQGRWGTARFRGSCHRAFRQERTQGPLCRHDAANFTAASRSPATRSRRSRNARRI
jgi:enoyl-[acyl-carrier-protein] reductase (NADH)